MLKMERYFPRSHVSSMTTVENQTLLSRSHVSSMTGGCTYVLV